jgi:hypothetical protein
VSPTRQHVSLMCLCLGVFYSSTGATAFFVVMGFFLRCSFSIVVSSFFSSIPSFLVLLFVEFCLLVLTRIELVEDTSAIAVVAP